MVEKKVGEIKTKGENLCDKVRDGRLGVGDGRKGWVGVRLRQNTTCPPSRLDSHLWLDWVGECTEKNQIEICNMGSLPLPRRRHLRKIKKEKVIICQVAKFGQVEDNIWYPIHKVIWPIHCHEQVLAVINFILFEIDFKPITITFTIILYRYMINNKIVYCCLQSTS